MTDPAPTGRLTETPAAASRRGEALREYVAEGVAPPPALLDQGPLRTAGPSRGFWSTSFRRLLGNRLAIFALLLLLCLTVASFCAPLIARAMGLERDVMDLTNRYQPPSLAHPFGTDAFGRDYFVRVLYGGQISILMGIGVAAVILLIAFPLGLVAGYYGGVVDDVFNWVVQIMVTTPIIFALILITSWLVPTPLTLAVIIGAFSWMGNARQARGLAFQLKRSDYVLAARALGARNGRIIFRHIMPNQVSLMLILAGFDVVGGVLAETGLSFLGLGIRPPIPSWGNMLTDSRENIFRAPYLLVFPGLAIGTLVFAVYLFTDGLRDAFDPGLRE
jgi:peptide/nickel transport system permease protein